MQNGIAHHQLTDAQTVLMQWQPHQPIPTSFIAEHMVQNIPLVILGQLSLFCPLSPSSCALSTPH